LGGRGEDRRREKREREKIGGRGSREREKIGGRRRFYIYGNDLDC
jgi:hypothetical protein